MELIQEYADEKNQNITKIYKIYIFKNHKNKKFEIIIKGTTISLKL